MNELSLADVAALRGNNNDGFGDGNGFWIILLFILLGGWGNRGFGNQGGAAGGNELYPWLNQTDTINGGFRDQMLYGGITGIQSSVTAGFAAAATQLCNCCSEIQMALCNGFAGTNMALAQGFAGVEAGANARQMANMQTQFGMQTAMMQGFNGVQAQTAQLASDIQLGNAQQTATILAENCADRAALSDGVRDIIASQTAGIQRILDKLCDQELQAERRENDQLRQQLNMANLAASQAAQTAQILQGQNAEVDALYQRLSNCPVPSTPVYGRIPIFNCNNGCGCGAAA